MNPTETFIRRPVMTTLLMLGMLFFGAVAYWKLPVSYLPAVDFPTIQVTASLPGASARTMASSVASPLEREFSDISGLTSMSSASSQGLTKITLQFRLGLDINAAAMDVQSSISKASGDLPPNMPSPPTYDKVDPAQFPVVYLSMRSDSLPLSSVNDYAKTFVTRRMSTLQGVSEVLIYGEQKYAVRIRLDPRLLAAKGISLDEVRRAVARQNVDLPVGVLEGRDRTLTLEVDGQLLRAEGYDPIIIAYRGGQPVRLKDVGEAISSVQCDRAGCWTDGKMAIVIAIKRQPGSNAVAVVERVKGQLPTILRQLPASIDLRVTYDRSVSIKASVDDVKFTLALAVALVVMVVFLFLRSVASTLIAALAVPFSIVTTFAVMYQMGFTLDILSLMALTLSVGFVVDDAIVMLENIVRHVDMGKKPLRAALDGAREIGFTIVSMTLCLVVVFIPIIFMAGMLGRILNEFAMTIAIATLVSGLVSLSLTPMLCSRILRKKAGDEEDGFVFRRLKKVYGRALGLALRHRFVSLVLAAALLWATAHVFLLVPKGFQPPNDEGFIMGFAMGQEGVSFKSMARHQRELTPIIRADPDVRSALQVVGYPVENQGMIVVLLKELGKRKHSADEVLRRLWPRLLGVPGLLVFLKNPPMIPMGGKRAKGGYEFTLTSPETDTLFHAAEKFKVKMAALPELVGVNSDLEIKTPEVDIRINRDRASALGVSAEAIENALFIAFGSREISTIYGLNDDYKVITELLPEFQRSAADLSMVYVESDSGGLVRLDTLADIKAGYGPQTINHTGQLPSVSLSFSLKPGVSLGQATKAVEDLARRELPATVTTQFEGAASAFQKSVSSVMYLLVLAVVVIYIILGCLYESFLHPLTILSGLPAAAFGGALTLLVFGCELDLYGFVGLIMLIGIVQKNGIMVVDFAIQSQKSGKCAVEAAHHGAIIRFRPILMTTCAATMGALPIAVGYGAGGESRRSLGMVVVGGLVISQVVTLFMVPVFYTYMDSLARLFSGGRSAPEPGPEERVSP